MNDDFLHRIRVEPPAGFMARLKARLDLQPPPTPPAPRRSMLRVLMFGLLFGGSVFAITLLTVNGVPDFARNLIQPQLPTRMEPASAPNSTLKINGTQTFGTERQPARAAAPTTVQTPRAAANLPQSTTKTDTPSKPQSISGATSSGYIPPAALITPKGLEAYVTAIAGRGRGATSLVTVTATNTEAFEKLCGTSPAKKATFAPSPQLITTRRINHTEFNTCTRAIGSIAEVEIGRQAIVLARSKLYGAFALTPTEIFLALAAEIPDPAHPDKLIPNPNKNWSDINSALEVEPIEVMGPDPASPLGSAFRELIFEAGCNALPAMPASRDSERLCKSFRKDGAYIEMPDESVNSLSRLQLRPNAFGVLTYSALDRNTDVFAASPITGVVPTRESILAGTYPASRTLYLYMNLRSPGYSMYDYVSTFMNIDGYFPETFGVLTLRAPELGNTEVRTVKLIELKL